MGVVFPPMEPVSASAVGAAKFHAATELARLFLPIIPMGLIIMLLNNPQFEESFGKVIIGSAITGFVPWTPICSLMLATYYVLGFSAGRFGSPEGLEMFLKTGIPAVPYAVSSGTWLIATLTTWVLARKSGLKKTLSELQDKSNKDCLTVEFGVGWFVEAYSAALLVLVSAICCLGVSPWVFPAVLPLLGVAMGLAQYRVLLRLVDRVKKGWEPTRSRLYYSIWLQLVTALFFNGAPVILAVYYCRHHYIT